MRLNTNAKRVGVRTGAPRRIPASTTMVAARNNVTRKKDGGWRAGVTALVMANHVSGIRIRHPTCVALGSHEESPRRWARRFHLLLRSAARSPRRLDSAPFSRRAGTLPGQSAATGPGRYLAPARRFVRCAQD